MTTTAAAQEHRSLCNERTKLVARLTSGQITTFQVEALTKVLDARIGRLAQAFNPRIADKAKAWLEEN